MHRILAVVQNFQKLQKSCGNNAKGVEKTEWDGLEWSKDVINLPLCYINVSIWKIVGVLCLPVGSQKDNSIHKREHSLLPAKELPCD